MSEKPPSKTSEIIEGEHEPRNLSPEEADAILEEAKTIRQGMELSLQEMRDELEVLQAASARDEAAIAQKEKDIRYAEEELSLFPEYFEDSQKPAEGFIPTITKKE